MLADRWDQFPEAFVPWRAAYVDALVVARRLDDARVVAEGLADHAAIAEHASVATDAARARASVAAACGDAEAADDLFEAGLALDHEEARDLHRGQLELAAGAHRRRSGRRREAAALLGLAAGRFQHLGAAPWLARCERELLACGLRPVRSAAGGTARSAELTPQERVVANFVGAGRSNRDVAAELVISVKTVEHHLSRIYAKLGVRSRSELAALLATDGP
jgi:DNA-binding CsgD family transcriptional regulator